ncbi:MAG: hypothetical protein WCC53_12690 [Thermoanaerobaculia bacterium]
MSHADVLLEVSRVLVALGLAVFVGAPLAALIARSFRSDPPPAQAGRTFFFEGEEGRECLGRARFMAAGALLVGVLLEVQVVGSSLPPRHVWRAAILFLLVASLVYSVMVVAPRARYYDERSFTFEENLRGPWHARRDAARARGSRINLLCFLLALAALVLG